MPRIQQEEKTGRYTITLPKEIIMFKGWEKGDVILFNINEKDRVELRLQGT